jgi:hypothetical protein
MTKFFTLSPVSSASNGGVAGGGANEPLLRNKEAQVTIIGETDISEREPHDARMVGS